MAFVAELLGDNVFNKDGIKIDLNKVLFGKTVGIYFAASWCIACDSFTPILKDFYLKHHENKNFEIILISWDRTENDFKTNYANLPWLSLGFNEKRKKEELCLKYGVTGIPRLILLNADDGNIYINDAWRKIQFDNKTGSRFPWKNEAIKSSSCVLL